MHAAARVAAFIAVWVLAATNAAQAQGFWRSCPRHGAVAAGYEDALIPGVSWDGWRALLGVDWTAAERAQPDGFDADALLRAAATVPATPITPADSEQHFGWPTYAPPGRDATEAETDGYRQAAILFHAGQWQAAIASFDPIAGGSSPYRAAAAYSAARAAFDASDVAGGIRRIAALLADPADRRMRGAALDLVGTLAWNTGSAPLLAVQFARISHLLMAPPEVRCGGPDLAFAAVRAEYEWDDLQRFAFFRPNGDGVSLDQSPAITLKALGTVDPVIDLLRLLRLATPRAREIWTQPFDPLAPAAFDAERDTIAPLARSTGGGEDPLAYVREKAHADGNPLWVLLMALLSHDAGDLPAIRQAAQTLRTGQDVPADRRALAGWLTAAEVRILLLAGRRPEAEAIVQRDLDALTGAPHRWGPRNTPAAYLWQGGTYLYLDRGDVADARSWAALFAREDAQLDPTGDRPFSLTLATDWTSALAGGVGPAPSDDRGWRHGAMPDDIATALDLLPAERLVAVARTPGLRPAWRRPILGAAWLRDWMLGREAAFEGLFPEVRTAFPETARDIDAIDGAWLPWTRRRLEVRMLLRLPGLSPRVLWNRDVSPARRGMAFPSSVLEPDKHDPNDGNWWCPLHPVRIRQEALQEVAGRFVWTGNWINLVTHERYGRPPEPALSDPQTRAWLDVFPLTREGDDAELDALSTTQSGPYRLTEAAIAWSRHSNMLTRWLGLDEALPETLALAVRSTRWGCRSAEELGPPSRAAWTALQKIAPRSSWAERTPYWFAENDSRRER